MNEFSRVPIEGVTDDFIELNAKYAVVIAKGKTRVAFWDDGQLVLMTFADFRRFHSNQQHYRVANPDAPLNSQWSTAIELGKWWLDHPFRRQYDDVEIMRAEGPPKDAP